MSPIDRQPGDVLEGRYRLVRRLGQGGFGDVWRAEELLPDGSVLREVALKLLFESVSDATDWAAEARIIASLRHPALVTIYAAGLLDLGAPCPFVAMELLLGDTLATWVARGQRVRWRRVLAWAREAASALDVIHRAGVVHLDLKPANLFVAGDGSVKVLDFGIARQGGTRTGPAARMASGAPGPIDVDAMSTADFVVAQSEEGATAAASSGTTPITRSVVGTPGYMAPEILEDGEASPAADAYALAACIVQLCTGRLPQRVSAPPRRSSTTAPTATDVQGWYAEVHSATVRGQLHDLARDEAGLPAALCALLGRWLALDPVARGVERGSMRASLDAVWDVPHGWTGNPYRGLWPYAPEDEGRLPGRDDDIARIGRELSLQPCAVLQGPGGAGLRSLAVAGVVPFLGRAFADDRDDWTACVVDLGRPSNRSPDSDLLRALRAWLDEQRTGTPVDPAAVDNDDTSAAEATTPGEEDLLAALRAQAADARVGLALVISEAHRLLDAEPTERAETVRVLLSLLDAPAPGLRVLLTTREERAASLLQLGQVGAELRPWLRYIGPPAASAAEGLVRAARVSLGDEGGEVDLDPLLSELRTELRRPEPRLPLLSLALHAWWEEGERTGAAWNASGGVLGAAARHAEAVVASFRPASRALCDRLLLQMVTLDGKTRAVEREELLGRHGAEDRSRVDDLLGRLVHERIVEQRGTTLRLTHGALPGAWPRLDDLRLRDLDRLTFLEELRDASGRWTTLGRSPGDLWPASRLRELRRRVEIEAELGDDERDFVAASRRAVRFSWGVRLVTALAVAGVIVGAIWFQESTARRAREQQQALERARHGAAVGELVTRSRRAKDPYLRLALLSEAMQQGSTDPLLPLELTSTARDLPTAQFLSLQKVSEPAFPWGPRWLVGRRGAVAQVLDFQPLAGADWGPVPIHFRPHDAGLYDLVPLPFDTAFVSRGLDGELRVWRLRDDGSVALAAISPMRCLRGLSQVIVAERAPVIACSTAAGMARWDLRQAGEAKVDAFQGRVLDLSPDGRWLAAVRLGRLLVDNPADGRRVELDVEHPPSLGTFSPRDDGLLALARPDSVVVYDLTADPPRVVVRREPLVADPSRLRWHEGGLDVAVCSYEGDGEWLYLRDGGRAPDDPEAPDPRKPCDIDGEAWPQRLNRVRDYGAVLQSGRDLGPRELRGGWKLEDGRMITRDLVMFDGHDDRARGLLHFRPRETRPEVGVSAAAVVRDAEDRVVWQVGDTVRIYSLDGNELLRRDGFLLARCPDARLLAWRRPEPEHWELFDARHEVVIAKLPREPALMVGADPTCRHVLVQRLDGQLLAADLSAGADARLAPVEAPGGKGAFEGYVYDARPSRPGQPGAGLWLAFSEGALARVESGTARVVSYGQATPRASALADGPAPGELLFADERGVWVRPPSGPDRLVLEPGPRVWEDARMLGPDTALLSWSHGVAVIDLARREVLGELETGPRGRLSTWDEQGSLLSWPFSFKGPPVGDVIPIDPALAGRIGAAVSNLRARLDAQHQVHVDLRP